MTMKSCNLATAPGLFVAIAACLVASGCDRSDATPEAVCLTDAQIGAFAPIAGGVVEKGTYAIYPEERGSGAAEVAPFEIQIHEVTIAQFAAFVAATGYKTDVEKSIEADAIGAGSAVFDPNQSASPAGPWRLDESARWDRPGGVTVQDPSADQRPVTQVSHHDANAYARWAGGRLPTEEEFERAAQAALSDPARRDSGAFDDDGAPIANTWQGMFPFMNDAADGYAGVAPVGCFAPSEDGVYDLIGNVWEWTASPYRGVGQHTIKGGSFLCAKNFCRRFRPEARQPHESNFSTNHIGFRIVRDVEAAAAD